MSNLDFSVVLQAPNKRLMELATDYENLSNYLPQQLKNVKILEKNEKETTTLEIIEFSNYLKKSFEQKTIHKKISENKLQSQVISGPAKGTIITMTFEEVDPGTKISVDVELRLSLAAKFLLPIIKKWYKRIILAILYKMNAIIINE